MNLQQLMRAAICAALVVVCLAGAGWLLAQPASGQKIESGILYVAGVHGVEYGKPLKNSSTESVALGSPTNDQQIYRAGLRNSFWGPGLSAEELNQVLTQLRHKTGFVQMRFDEAGFLTIDDRSQIMGGSATGRELLLAAVDGNKSITLQSHNGSPNVIFARVGKRMNCTGWRSDEQIEVAPIEIDFADFNHLRGERKAMEAFDLGFVILHELCHAALELHDPSAGMNAAGDCEHYVNRIRRELGIPERQNYVASASRQSQSPSAPTATIARLVFAQIKPGRQPQSRAKTKTLHLRWDVRQVGNNR